MRLQLERAWIDDLLIHDIARLNDPTLPYALRSAKRGRTVRRVQEDKRNRNGIIDRTRPLYGSQTIDLAGYVDAGSPGASETAFDVLEGYLTAEGAHTFRFRRLGLTEDEQVTFTLGDGPDAPAEGYAGRTVKYSVTLVGADPRVYSATLKSSSYDPTGSLSGGGMTLPMVFPLTFSSTTATELYLSNQGQTPTPPIFTVKGPVANPIIDNDTTAESIYLLYTLGAADTVIIDVAARTVTLNGAIRQDLFDASRSKWFELGRGETRVRLRGSNMAAGQTLLTVTFRDARV